MSETILDDLDDDLITAPKATLNRGSLTPSRAVPDSLGFAFLGAILGKDITHMEKALLTESAVNKRSLEAPLYIRYSSILDLSSRIPPITLFHP